MPRKSLLTPAVAWMVIVGLLLLSTPAFAVGPVQGQQDDPVVQNQTVTMKAAFAAWLIGLWEKFLIFDPDPPPSDPPGDGDGDGGAGNNSETGPEMEPEG